MSNEYFDKVADKIGFDNLNVEIVDGKFIITPSDAGLLIFAHLDIAEKQLLESEKEVLALQNELEGVRDDNYQVRDLLDRCYGVLVEVGVFVGVSVIVGVLVLVGVGVIHGLISEII
jgi:hypothetical protein